MLYETYIGCQLYSWLEIINGKARLNPERKKKWTADAKFATIYISNRNLQKLQLTLFDKTKRWKIYIKLIKGWSKRPDSTRKFITGLIMPSFKEIVFFFVTL